jgi:hypothetical protein
VIVDPRTAKLLAEREQRAAAAPPRARGPVAGLNSARTWARTHTVAAKVGAAALAVVLLAAYYVLVTIPSQRLDRAEEAARTAEKVKSETTSRQTAVTECLSKAETEATARWTSACKARRERAGCTLSAQQTDALDREESLARNSCLTRFSLGEQ